MIDWFINSNYLVQALVCTLFTFFVTALGSSLVFMFKSVNKNILDAMLGISSGVMIAASFFSLLSPAIEMCDNLKMTSYIVLGLGFVLGALLLFISDKLLDKKYKNKSHLKRMIMLVSSITIHNIPEGLAIGVSIGSLMYGLDSVTLISCVMLALGIGIQNFPEGSCVSLPLRREGMSKGKAFLVGALTAVVEPIAGVLGAYAVTSMRFILPYALSFAAGAMIYVVVVELIPESSTNRNKALMGLYTILGFIIMMCLDIGIK